MRLSLTFLAGPTLLLIVYMILKVYAISIEHRERRHPFVSSDIQILTYINANKAEPINILDEKLKSDLNIIEVYLEAEELRIGNFSKESEFHLFLILDNKENINLKLSELIEKKDISQSVLFFSPYKNVIKNIRQVKPQWLTAYSHSEIFNMILLSKLRLAELFSNEGDFLFLDKSFKYSDLIEDIPWSEVFRRNKKVIADKDFAELIPNKYRDEVLFF